MKSLAVIENHERLLEPKWFIFINIYMDLLVRIKFDEIIGVIATVNIQCNCDIWLMSQQHIQNLIFTGNIP